MLRPHIIDITLIHSLLEQGECETIEFKGPKPGGHHICEYVSAIANMAFLQSKEYGWLLMGINDNGDIIGTDHNSTQEDIKNELMSIKDKSAQSAHLHIEPVIIDNKRVLVYQIKAAKPGIPVSSSGFYHGREGSHQRPLSDDEKHQILQAPRNHDWSGQLSSEADINDLDPEALALAKSKYMDAHEKIKEDIQKWPDEVFLEKIGLYRQNKLTNAAIILLGKKGTHYKIELSLVEIRWILKDKTGVEIDYRHLPQPLLLAADEAFRLIRNTKYRYMTGESIFPDTLWRYDEYILREAINNAIAHSKYSHNASIDIIEFENERIVISNMGYFLPNTIDKVLNSDEPISIYRNNTLAQAMVELKLIDKVGSGIRTMFSKQRERLFPMPEYEINQEKTKVTIQGKILDINFAQALSNRSDLELLDLSLLYDVYCGRHIEKAASTRLKRKKLITGRYPKLRISTSLLPQISEVTIKQNIIKRYEMSSETFASHIKDALRDGSFKSRREIFEIIHKYLPDSEDKSFYENKLSNILKDMKEQGIVEVHGIRKWATWRLIPHDRSILK